MNIAVVHQFKAIDPADLAVAAGDSAGALMEADAALDRYIAAISNLISVGVEASATIGRPSCLVSPRAFGFAAQSLHLAVEIQANHLEIHNALHGDGDRLAPNDDAQRAGGGGGKEVPPKP